MKAKRLGIIGGLGPETGFKFCLNINNKFKEITNTQPDITLENLPISAKAENDIIHGKVGEEHLALLKTAVERLNKIHNKVDLISVPCNTVHVFIDELRKISQIPILSIIEECAKVCKEQKIKKIGILASTKTVNEKLHEKELKKENIELIIPIEQHQKNINKIIIKAINNKTTSKDKEILINHANRLVNEGAQAIVLGCTELPMLIKKK
ncbi:aspartate/glutamate racemase family protein [Candidatus Woesearchaeota archaeon]|jgi:aspartate racemase|nr:aspartate/glutamate racemase family protein [Candidatus Woesearchaeota archaeon]MBT5271710.1 aspartate/glutamate racemase family protein [Candidatus Woesearchaeota archaeon]MBT6041100.1 aspartate/glutamate racemase family protein [Candidatus Woesearchaeota archaeon]MBT6337425.1 aspartate/glutamate racemase family protein [Candidatus Woesearchaeota archaeon]MBT7926914.1 aspartate/glutamate racemase family protein [Candidatus Woesearchaeota archaeon]